MIQGDKLFSTFADMDEIDVSERVCARTLSNASSELDEYGETFELERDYFDEGGDS